MKDSDIIREIQLLSAHDKERVLNHFKYLITPMFDTRPVFQEINESKTKEGLVCSHCQSNNVIRFGKFEATNGLRKIKRQRYRCKECTKTFTETNATPIYRLKKANHWLEFIECMLLGLSLRESAKRMKDISHTTLFFWRHKILSALTQIDINVFDGIVEIDETYFLYSEKGSRHIQGRKPRKRGGSSQFRGISKEQVCVLVARDRTKNTFVGVLGRGRIQKSQLEGTISPKLNETNIHCTDAWRAFKTYATEIGLPYYRFKTGLERTKGIYHIQNVNNYHQRLKQWILRFKGVATKYLQHYLAYFNFLDILSFSTDNHSIRKFAVESCIHPINKTNSNISFGAVG